MSACPACGSISVTNFRTYNRHPLLKCSDCGFVYTAQRDFATAQYEGVYSEMVAYQVMKHTARQTHEGKLGYKHLWWFKRMGLRWLRKSKPSGRLLDIGSGPGTFLMIAKRDFGFEIQGIEPASEAASMANIFDVPTFNGTVDEFEQQNPGQFDAIVSFEVFEHISNPLTVLLAARRLLKTDGVLILSIPNLDDPYCLDQQIAPAMPPIHINFFSRRSVNALLRRAGFAMQRSFSLPIPTSSVRNIHGRKGFLLRLPYLIASKLLRKQDGTTLLVMAVPASTERLTLERFPLL
jgi:2-polyprenyl-3-methyl-5-hydroxy-6-metoxy-1,4-benzoquinol methylase